MPTDLITMKCIKGEEWPATEFKSFVNTEDEQITENSVTLYCPVGHKFTLREALSKDIFSEEQAKKILAAAKKLYEEYKNKDWSVHTASDFLPDKGLVALNYPCAKCGELSQRQVGGRFENGSYNKERALCLKCYALWYDYDKELFDCMIKTWGKPAELMWEIHFNRFLEDEPKLNRREAEELLEECRKKARRIKPRRSI